MKELGELETHHADFARRNARVVVVSLEGREDADKTQADFPHLLVVSDQDRNLATAVAVIHSQSAADGGDTAAPTTVLVDRKGTVHWLYRPERYIARLSASELLAALDEHFPGNH